MGHGFRPDMWGQAFQPAFTMHRPKAGWKACPTRYLRAMCSSFEKRPSMDPDRGCMPSPTQQANLMLDGHSGNTRPSDIQIDAVKGGPERIEF